VSGATTTTKKSAAQVPFAHKTAKLKAKRRKPSLSAKLIAANQAHIIGPTVIMLMAHEHRRIRTRLMRLKRKSILPACTSA